MKLCKSTVHIGVVNAHPRLSILLFLHHWVRNPGKEICLLKDVFIHQIVYVYHDCLAFITHLPTLFFLDESALRRKVLAMLNDLAIDPCHIYRFPYKDLGVILHEGDCL